MTDPTTIVENGFTFRRETINNLADAILDHILDRFDGAFDAVAADRLDGPPEPSEDNEEASTEYYCEAYDAVVAAVLRHLSSQYPA
jgi:hypothetical protein